jgi:RNA polymerase sigma factor for flagellar operon FliA
MKTSLPANHDVNVKTQSSRPQKILGKYSQANSNAREENELVRKYLPLVKTIVGRVAIALPKHIDADDLISAGLIGLINAIRNYDPTGGCSFESYARTRIKGAVLDELRKMDWVPRSVHTKAKKLQDTINSLEQKLGHIPSNQEVAEELGISEKEYENLLEEVQPATFVSLDSVVNSDSPDSPSHYDTISDTQQKLPSDIILQKELTRLIAERLEQLPEIQRKILALYYFEGMRLKEIAEAYGVTESRICQIHAQAILAIKAYIQRYEAGIERK